MEQLIITALSQLDCSPKEIKLYLASFKLGPAKIGDIAKKARLQRSTAYLLCDQLIEKQLFSHDSSAYGKNIIAASPDTLIRLLETRKRRIGRSSLTLSDHIDQLRDLYGTSDVIPRLSTYHGLSGLRTVLSLILGSHTDIRLWTNQESERHVFASTEHTSFVKTRIKNGIAVRVLAVNNTAGQKLLETDADSLRTTRLLPSNITFSAETYLFENKVVILDFTADIIAIVIDNSSVHNAHVAQFEVAWHAASMKREV